MLWYHYIALVALIIFLGNFMYHLFRLIRAGKPVEYSVPAGKVNPAVIYSFTGAMSPAKKESAFLHLPTYTAGIIYHLGTFLAIALFLINWFIVFNISILTYLTALFLFISALSGIGILIKRCYKTNLRKISNPDDYISNILVTLFQAITGVFLIIPSVETFYYLLTALLLLYFPLGKLKHALYFFAARYHLGFFYGWRGVWPPKHINP